MFNGIFANSGRITTKEIVIDGATVSSLTHRRIQQAITLRIPEGLLKNESEQGRVFIEQMLINILEATQHNLSAIHQDITIAGHGAVITGQLECESIGQQLCLEIIPSENLQEKLIKLSQSQDVLLSHTEKLEEEINNLKIAFQSKKQLMPLSNWGLPQDNNPFFIKRTKELDSIHTQFNSKKISEKIILSAVSGLGGVGKTQLAAYYVHHADFNYSQRLWFHAETITALRNDCLNFARAQGLIDATEKPSDRDSILVVKEYLENHINWLAVYDNAGKRQDLESFLPKQGGHVIVTTRLQDWKYINYVL